MPRVFETATVGRLRVGINHCAECGSVVRPCFGLPSLRRDRRGRGSSGRGRNRIATRRTFARCHRYLIAPAAVLNFGIRQGWEAVLEGQGQTLLSPSGHTTLTAAGAFLKHVLHPGSLQDESGPSVATEFGVLLPDSTGNSGVGASLAGIVSQRWEWGTIHLNAETALTRDHRGDVFLGGIIEGPSTWSVRPVAEFFYENEFGKSDTISGLIGLIWRVRDNLSFDVGLRHALANGHPVNEVRAGLTFGFPVGQLGGRQHSSNTP